MAWSDEALVVTGDIITAAWGNRRRSNERYLKGQDGPVQIEDEVRICDSSFQLVVSGTGVFVRFDTDDNLSYDRANDRVNFNIGGTTRARVDANGLHSSDGTTLMRVQRHPYSNNRHIESGSASLNAGNTSSVTFTNAYASAPNVVFGSAFTNGDGLIYGASIATTGFTLTNGTAANGTCYWLSEGQD